MTLDYAETNGHASSNASSDELKRQREAFRQANDKIVDILESLDAEQRGRLLRGLKEHYSEDMKKNKARTAK